jgi:hypothetical protein
MLTVAIDTNVLLNLDDGDCRELINRCREKKGPPRFVLAFDDAGEIKNEYGKYAKAESAIREILFRIMDDKIPSVILDCNLKTDSDGVMFDIILKESSCDQPIEPQLLGMTWNHKDVLIISPDGISCRKQRQYPGTLHNLRHRICNTWGDKRALNVLSVREALEVIRNPSRIFTTKSEIENYLERFALKDGDKLKETETIEFKAPEAGENGILNHHMLKLIARGVCGLLNKGGGFLFFGVRNDGEVVGFWPQYKPVNGLPQPPDIDYIMRIVSEEIMRIRPSAAHLVSIDPTKIASNQYVLAIFARSTGVKRRYKFYNDRPPIAFERLGSETVETDL